MNLVNHEIQLNIRQNVSSNIELLQVEMRGLHSEPSDNTQAIIYWFNSTMKTPGKYLKT